MSSKLVTSDGSAVQPAIRFTKELSLEPAHDIAAIWPWTQVSTAPVCRDLKAVGSPTATVI